MNPNSHANMVPEHKIVKSHTCHGTSSVSKPSPLVRS
jgi:hypothetical protein